MLNWVPQAVISTWSYQSLGIEINALTGGLTPASGAYGVANDAVFTPLYLQWPVRVKRLWVANGATVNGNLDVGIYSVGGTRLVSAGTTAQSGSNALQFFDIADLLLGAGAYYLAVAFSSTTATLFRGAPALGRVRQMGLAKMASAMPLPATVTLAVPTVAFIPMMGIEPYQAL